MISVAQLEKLPVEISDDNNINDQLGEPMDIDTPELQQDSANNNDDLNKLKVVGLEPISSPTKSIRQSTRETLVPNIQQQQQMIVASKPRLVIERLILTNFKSYAGRQEIGPFHPSFSAVVGPNGSGKSNVIDSMLFVFGFRASKMRQSKLSELIHNSEAFPELSFCQVDIHFKRVVDKIDENNQPYSEYVEGSDMIVSRRANRDNSSKYFVDNNSSSYTQVTNLLKDQGVDLDHKRFLILQGEVESIAQMKPKADNENDDGLLEYLEDIIGTTKYKGEIEKIDEEIEKLSDLCNEKESRFKFAKKSKNDLDSEKSKALDFLKLEKRCIDENTRYLKLSSAYDNIILESSTEKLEELQEKLGSDMEIINKSQSVINKLEKDHTAVMKSVTDIGREIDTLKNSHKSIEQSKVSLSEKMKHIESKEKKALKTLESNNKLLNGSESQLRDLKDNLANYEEETTGLNDQLEKEKEVLETIKSELSDRTKKFSEQIEILQKQLEPWKNKIDNKQGELNLRQSEIDILTTQLNEMENEESEVKKIIENKKEQIDVNKAKVQKLKGQKIETETNIHKNMTIFQSKEKELKLMETSLKELRDKVEYARANVSNAQSQNRVTAALQHLKDSGRLRGFYGRLGDLGVIDDKYDVAVSTGCGSLHDYVVETVEDAQQCIQYLRTQNVGFGRFIVLQKLRKFNLGKINTPENVPRLFDLITPSNQKFAPAFYSSMFDTLVTPNLQVANRVAFGGKKRWRVVTMDGKLVDISGTMSGGGSRVSKGAMKLISSKSTGDDVSPQQLEQWRNELQNKEDIYNNADSAFRRMEQVMRKAQDQLPEMDSEISRLNVETESLTFEIKESQEILKELLSNKGSRDTIIKNIAKETKILKKLKDEKCTLENDSKHLENQISDLQKKIMDVGGIRLKTQISKVNSINEKLHLLKERKESDDMKITRLENQIHKVSKQIEEDRTELDGFAQKKQSLETQYKEKLALFDNSKEKIDNLIKNKDKEDFEAEKLLIKLEDKRAEIGELNEKSRESLKMIKKYESAISHASDNIERISVELENMTYRNVPELLTWLDEGDPELISLLQGPVSFENLSEDELKNLDFKEISDRVDELKEKLSNTFANLDVLLEYGRRHQAYLDQKKDLEDSTNLLSKVKEDCELLKKKRFDEFQAGFQAISSTLREMYHMITMGGNAELEFFDSHDPFSEGVVFSVMPPKKSWRNISNLSGGEKTLASLALVFALHHYKPTPLYVMDEIDAALDFRNVSIVANYIKGRTRNAQFIVISLRNNMFELAERLVGIYKTNNMTKSATLVNKDLL